MQQHELGRHHADSTTHQASTQQQPPETTWKTAYDDPIVVLTLILALATLGLWVFTAKLWRATVNMANDARQSAIDQGDKMEQHITEAAKSAMAATDQIKISQDTAYRELRAYLSVESMEIADVQSDALKGKIIIRNAGKTPAAIQVFIAQYVGPHPLTALPAEAHAPMRWTFHSPYLNATSAESIDWFYPMITHLGPGVGLDDLKRVMQYPKNVVIYCYGRVEFIDYMRRKRILHFAYRNHGGIELGSPCEMIPLPFGNDYEDCGQQT